LPSSIVRTSVPDVVEALELSIGSGDAGFTRTELVVPQDSLALAITVTDAGPDGHTRGPRDVNVVVRNPARETVSNDASHFPDGQFCILIDTPMEGTWEIDVEYGAEA